MAARICVDGRRSARVGDGSAATGTVGQMRHNGLPSGQRPLGISVGSSPDWLHSGSVLPFSAQPEQGEDAGSGCDFSVQQPVIDSTGFWGRQQRVPCAIVRVPQSASVKPRQGIMRSSKSQAFSPHDRIGRAAIWKARNAGMARTKAGAQMVRKNRIYPILLFKFQNAAWKMIDILVFGCILTTLSPFWAIQAELARV